MSIGIWQIAIVVILVVLLFGRGKISSLMGDVAKGVKNFKSGMAEETADSQKEPVADEGGAAQVSESSENKENSVKS